MTNEALISNEVATVSLNAQSIKDALSSRRVAESDQHSLNENKSNTLRKLERYATDAVASTFNAANVTLDFVCHKQRCDAMCDVYEIDKIFDLADYIAQSNTVSLNHYTRFIAMSAMKFQQASVEFSLDAVRSACSTLEKCRDAKKEKLVVKYLKDVKLSTVTAQHRSSLEALKFFNILRERRNAQNERCFVIVESDFSKAFFEKIAA